MQIKAFGSLVTIALLLSACGSFATESPTENITTATSPEVSKTETVGVLLIWESVDSPCETAAMTIEGLYFGESGGAIHKLASTVTNHSARTLQLSMLCGTY